MNKFNFRSFVSLLIGFASLFLLISGTVLLIMPHGRIAYWLNWKLFSINKTGWETLHVMFAIIFLITGILHLFTYNWKAFKNYIKKKKASVVSTEFGTAVIVSVVLVVLSIAFVPPVSTFMEANEKIKDSWVSKKLAPPFPHAELMSIEELSVRENIDPAQAVERIRQAGIKFKGKKQSIASVAKKNDISARKIFLIMKGEK